MPITIAIAVIKIGRVRVQPASIAASSDERANSIRSAAKVTSKIEFAVATPIDMIAPISEGTLKVLCVRKRDRTDAGEGAGQCRDDDERIFPALEVYDHEQVNEQSRGNES